MNLDAVLKLAVAVTGKAGLDGLSQSLQNLTKKTTAVDAAMGKLGNVTKGIRGQIGALIPLGVGAGLGMLASKAINAADHLNDLSLQTGVSVEQLSQFQGAAEDSGTTVDAVAKGIGRLNRGLEGAASGAESYGEAVERASESAEDAIRKGEERQIEIIEEAARRKLDALEDESDSRMRELNRRYRDEQTLLDDRYDDQADKDKEAADSQLRQTERAAQARFDAIRQSIKNDESLSDAAKDQRLDILKAQEDEQLNTMRDGFDRQQKLRDRQLRDEKRQEEDALNERKRLEEEAIRGRFDAQKQSMEKGVQSQIEIVKEGARQQIAALDGSAKGVAAALAEMGIATTDAAGKAIGGGELFLRISDAMKSIEDPARRAALAQSLFGKSGQEMIPLLLMGRKAIEDYAATIDTDMAQSADKFNEAMAELNRQLFKTFHPLLRLLMPIVERFVGALVGVLEVFTALPGPVQSAVLVIGSLLAGLLALAQPLAALIGLFSAGGAFAGIGAAIAGVGKAIALFFTGPVGWVALLVLAGVAIYAFRDKIGAAFKAVVDFIGNAFKTIGNILKAGAQAYMTYYVQPILGFFKGLYDGVINVFSKIGEVVGKIFTGVVNTVKAAFRSVLQYLADQINRAGDLVNQLITAFNRIPRVPDIPLVPRLTIPKFAQGGVVDRPTVAMVGEGGEREYIVPESKMRAASSSYLAGARGGAVLAGAAPSGGGAPTINITTGPVVEFDGQRYVTLADMERAMRLTAEGVIGRLRTPSARIALGIA